MYVTPACMAGGISRWDPELDASVCPLFPVEAPLCSAQLQLGGSAQP